MKFLKFKSDCAAFGGNHFAGEILCLDTIPTDRKTALGIATLTGSGMAEIIERYPVPEPQAPKVETRVETDLKTRTKRGTKAK